MAFTRRDTKIVKGIAIILMFYHHLFNFPERLHEGVSFVSPYNIALYLGAIGKICVAFYIFLGGYGTYLSSQKNENTMDFVGKKLYGLYTIYWKVLLVVLGVCIALGYADTNIELFLYNFTGIRITYNGEWWFFTPYVIILCMFPLLKRFIEWKNGEFIYDMFRIIVLISVIKWIVPDAMKLSVFGTFSASYMWEKLWEALQLVPGFLIGCAFAKYDVLSKAKARYSGSYIYSILAVVLVGFIFYIRFMLFSRFEWDYLYAPILTAAFSVIFSGGIGEKIGRVLELIGEENTIMWLTHSFFCYLWCQEIVFAPKYSVLIVIWLVIITYGTAKGIKLFYKYLGKGFLWLKGKLAYE